MGLGCLCVEMGYRFKEALEQDIQNNGMHSRMLFIFIALAAHIRKYSPIELQPILSN